MPQLPQREALGVSVAVVFDVETERPMPLGRYLMADESTVIYTDPDGERRMAPEDCVVVVEVEL